MGKVNPNNAVGIIEGRVGDLIFRVINDIDLSSYTGRTGETTSVVASDDFEVVTVCLTITELNETLIEHGAAVPESNSSKWR